MTWLRLIGAVSLSLGIHSAAVSAQTPQPPTTTTTAVLVNLTIKPGIDRSQVIAILPDEVRATVKLYLDGKIQQWYSRSDGRGVLFIVNSTTIADAQAVMSDLPLSKAKLADFEFTALGPLAPLRVLLATGQAGSEKKP